MAITEDILTHTLEAAAEYLEFHLDAASLDFKIADSPNANQRMIVFAEGERIAYVTAEYSWDDLPVVFVDIYRVDNQGAEHWVRGDMDPGEAAPYIARMLGKMNGEEGEA